MRIDLLTCIALFPLMSPQGIAQHPAFDAWKQRSSSTQSLELTWRQISEHHKAPSNPLTFEAEFVTSQVDQSREWRFDRVSFSHYPEHGFLAQRCITTVDMGGEHTNFFPQADRSCASASILTKGRTKINHLRLLPIAVLYFPFDVESWAIGDSSVAQVRSAKFKGIDCTLFKIGEYEAWVIENDKEFIPVRLTQYRDDGALRYDFQIAAKASPDGTVRLSHWSFRHFASNGDQLEYSIMRVEACKINAPLGSTAFSQLPFPKGTRVTKDGLASVVQGVPDADQ